MTRIRLAGGVLSCGLVFGCGSDSSALFAKGNGGSGRASTDAATGGAGSGGTSDPGTGGTSSTDTGGASGNSATGGTTSALADAAVLPPLDSGSGDVDPSLCHVGHYQGTFTGTYKTAATILPASLSLNFPLDLYLSESPMRGYLDLDASGTGYYLIVPYSGHITGHMNCKTGVVSDGHIVGSYGSGGGTTSFQGAVDGALGASTGEFSGTWNGKEANPAYGGNGTWNAKLVP